MRTHAADKDVLPSITKHTSAPISGRSIRMVFCTGTGAQSNGAIAIARTVGNALGAELHLVHAIETGKDKGSTPFDPVEWDIRRREAETHVARLATENATGQARVGTSILEGRCAEQFCAMLAAHPQDIAVISRKSDASSDQLGDIGRHALEAGTNSLLMVPADHAGSEGFSLSRIMVPLDGSSQSESAMASAMAIARSSDSELLLVHANPEAGLVEAGPAEPKDSELKLMIGRRNERVARRYLDKLVARLRSQGIKAKAIVLGSGDVRRQITGAVSTLAADLVVIASHGHSAFADVPAGNVSQFVLMRSSKPVLMVRQARGNSSPHVASDTRAKGVRSLGTLLQ